MQKWFATSEHEPRPTLDCLKGGHLINAGMGTEPKMQDTGELRPKWRTPRMTEDAVADVTMNVSNVPGSDGYDASPGYLTSGDS